MARRNPLVPGKARIIAALAAACAVALVGVSSAGAAGNQGVSNARNAGIKVDTAAARLMEQAPVGTCFNDPTQSKCPKGITKVVASDVVEGPDGSVGYAMLDEPAKAAPTKARASQDATISVVPQCFVRGGYPYYASGWMWGEGSQDCSLAVTDQELYVSLERTTDGIWRQLDYRWTQRYGGGTIRRTAGYDCGHSNQRHYRTVAQGYAVLKGVWYGAQNIHSDYKTC